MNNLSRIILWGIAFICLQPLKAQDLLTLEKATEIALLNNFDIQISKNNQEIAELNNSRANAGMLPRVNGILSNNNSLLNTTQTQATGQKRSLAGAKNLNIGLGVAMDWTVFDGYSMFARKEQLDVLEKQSELVLKTTVLSKISELNSIYFSIVQQQLQLKALDTTLKISRERLELAETRFSIGKTSKLEVLNAQVDLNADSSQFIQLGGSINQTKILLNQIMARDIQTDFTVIDVISIDEQLNIEALNSLVETQNPTLASQILGEKLANLDLKRIRGARYPTIAITTGYNFTHSQASLGFLTQSTGHGLVYGLSASVPIYDGSLQTRNEKIAKIEIENATTQIAQQKLMLQTQIATAFENYSIFLSLKKVEQKNQVIAKENLEISLAKLRAGAITPVEFRTAQQNLLDTQVRHFNAEIEAKLFEITLKTLSGLLI